MLKNMLAMRTKFAQTTTKSIVRPAPKRWFSANQVPQRYTVSQMLFIGVGTTGLMFLKYQSRMIYHQRIMAG